MPEFISNLFRRKTAAQPTSCTEQHNVINRVAYVRVDRDGSAYIHSNELSQLPEVQEMQRQAAEIVAEYYKNLDK
ncbi:TPA: hypothetical protein NHT78_001711 [Morganella morganii]|nr:hypothetical protein [Morganella morganii]